MFAPAYKILSCSPEEETRKANRYDDYRALGVAVKKSELPDILETLDPVDTGYIPYGPFLSLAAIHLHHHDDGEDEDQSEEVQEAYSLFTNNRPGPITLAHLRRIARLLKEDVSDDVLRDMLVEANGEGKEGWRRGVDIDAFEGVMRRAGVFG
jgi:Ca2+-binding EF-hand superfamily protein